MRRAFQAFLVLFGIIVIGISLAHFAIGTQAIIGGVAVNPTMAGEDRFFAGLLLCWGIALLWCAREVQHKRVYVDLLAAAFFVGAIGRLLAILLDGPPQSVLRRDARARAGATAVDGRRGQPGRRTGVVRALTPYVRGVFRSGRAHPSSTSGRSWPGTAKPRTSSCRSTSPAVRTRPLGSCPCHSLPRSRSATPRCSRRSAGSPLRASSTATRGRRPSPGCSLVQRALWRPRAHRAVPSTCSLVSGWGRSTSPGRPPTTWLR
jgi:Domain of unknown function (DUF4345)